MKKIITAILIAIFAMTAMLTLAACNTTTQPETPVVEQTQPDGELAFATDSARGLSIRKVATNPSNAQSVTLVATTEPADMQDVVLKWSIAWKNASGTWASGKNVNEYVAMDAEGLQATLTCLQAFGEQILVTVTSVDNPNATATCTIDYRKRANVTVTLTASDGTSVTLDETFSANGTNLAKLIAGKAYTVNVNVVEGVGTVGSYTVTQSYGGFDGRLFSTIGMENHNSCMIPSSRFDDHLGVRNSLTIDRDTIESWLNFDDWAQENEYTSEYTSEAISKIYSKGTNSHVGCWYVAIVNENGEKALETYFYFAIDVSSIRVTNITLNPGNIEF